MWSVASHSATAYSRNIGTHLKRMMSFTREMDVQKRPITYVTSSSDRMIIVEDPAVSTFKRIQDQTVHLSLKCNVLLAKDYDPLLYVQSLKQAATLLPGSALLYVIALGPQTWEFVFAATNLWPCYGCFCKCNISNTRDCVTSGYPNTEKQLKWIRRAVPPNISDEIQGIWIADETFSRALDIYLLNRNKN